jgi:hypothetical protein
MLANIPDIPLPYWGHARYAISHSPLSVDDTLYPERRSRLVLGPKKEEDRSPSSTCCSNHILIKRIPGSAIYSIIYSVASSWVGTVVGSSVTEARKVRAAIASLLPA